MKYVIGIDIGGSTTKIVGFAGGKMTSPLFVKATDPVASVYGAFGKFVAENGIALSAIEQIMITGVGSVFLCDKIYGIRTARITEFSAIGLGGLYLSKLDKAIIVSMGTGTAFVRATKDSAAHIGGTGMGGGTLLGLSSRMLQIHDFDNIIELAKDGNLEHVDLLIKDITKGSVNNLNPGATASNFGKMSDLATKSDIAIGIINMVFQTIGMMAVFNADKASGEKVVLTGSLTKLPQTGEVFHALTDIAGVEFVIPAHAEFATAAGAALAYEKGFSYTEI